MAKAGAWTTYYDMRLPFIYSLFDIALTLILCAEISLQLAALYDCRVCKYFAFSAEHKADVLVFLLSLLLCVFFLFNVFGVSDVDNMGFLALRIVRDVMRIVRCVLFAKFLYDGVVHLQTPMRKRGSRGSRLSMRTYTSDYECSSGWDAFEGQSKSGKDGQLKIVCL